MNMERIIELVPCFAVICLLLLAVMTVVAFTILAKILKLRDELYRIYARCDLIHEDTIVIRRMLDNVEQMVTATEADVSAIWDEVCCPKPCSEDDCDCKSDLEYVKDEKEELDIHLIKAEEYFFENEYDTHVLAYHVKANQLRYYTTRMLFIDIENIHELIGDGLMFFGINANEPNVVYVRNHKLKADFRIERIGYEGSNNTNE